MLHKQFFLDSRRPRSLRGLFFFMGHGFSFPYEAAKVTVTAVQSLSAIPIDRRLLLLYGSRRRSVPMREKERDCKERTLVLSLQ